MRRTLPVLLCGFAAALAATVAGVGSARACVRADEANKLLGWSADGNYALLALVDKDGKLDHAEIQPTRYHGSVYVILEIEEHQIAVTKVKVGDCASFGDEDPAPIVERKRGALTEAALMGLKTVKAMKFSRDEVVPPTRSARVLPAATFTGKKRYAVHDLELTVGTTTTVLPLPVWCVGSCLADERWLKWKATVAAVHTLASGVVLYELQLDNVCNGGTLIRVLAADPAPGKVPKSRCKGSG